MGDPWESQCAIERGDTVFCLHEKALFSEIDGTNMWTYVQETNVPRGTYMLVLSRFVGIERNEDYVCLLVLTSARLGWIRVVKSTESNDVSEGYLIPVEE